MEDVLKYFWIISDSRIGDDGLSALGSRPPGRAVSAVIDDTDQIWSPLTGHCQNAAERAGAIHDPSRACRWELDQTDGLGPALFLGDSKCHSDIG